MHLQSFFQKEFNGFEDQNDLSFHFECTAHCDANEGLWPIVVGH